MCKRVKRPANFCVCGRNIEYPARVTKLSIVCRCGRKHKLTEVS